jgi:hypothetical protein
MLTSCKLPDYDPEVIARQEEDVLPINEEEMSNDTFFAQASPEETRVAMSRLWGAAKRIHKVMSKIANTLSCKSSTDTLSQAGGSRKRR